MTTETINLNAAECIRERLHFGYTEYHNICSGAVTSLDWTVIDWTVGSLFLLMLIGVVIIVFGAISMIVIDR